MQPSPDTHMKIRFKSSMAGPFNAYHDGDEVDMPEAAARKLIARGIAEPVTAEPGRQEAEEQKVVRPPEKAVRRGPRKARGKR